MVKLQVVQVIELDVCGSLVLSNPVTYMYVKKSFALLEKNSHCFTAISLGILRCSSTACDQVAIE